MALVSTEKTSDQPLHSSSLLFIVAFGFLGFGGSAATHRSPGSDGAELERAG